jgi:hypothetical protein
MSQTLSIPPRSLVKAIVRPSSEYRECVSNAGPVLIGVAPPPVIGSV